MRVIVSLLLCVLLTGCGAPQKPQQVSSAMQAALTAVQALERGEDTVRLGYDAALDQEELFRAIEAMWPYAVTMQLTTYEGGLNALGGAGGVIEVTVTMADQARQTQAKTLAQGMAAQTVAGMSDDVEKLRALHDVLVRTCSYDLAAAAAEGQLDGASAPFTAYGALVDGKAVCAGYARAYVLLCRAAGLDAIYVADAGMNHGWNAVRLEGETYFIDCTFDDPVPDRGEQVSYDYFLRSTEQLKKTHTWDDDFYMRVMDEIWGK